MRRKKELPHENIDRWIISYADFITLLFAFFTVLYATSQADLEKQASFEKSFKKAMGIFRTSGGSDTGVMSEPFPAFQKDGSPIESQIKIFQNFNASNAEKKDALWQMIDQKLTPSQIKAAGLSIRDDVDGVRISFQASKLFDEGSAKILPSALRSLDIIGTILKLSNRRLIIEGYTDNTKVESEIYPSNWELAGARASMIVRYLIHRHNIEPDLLSAVSYGDQKPVVANDTPEDRAKNRRIEILISTK